MMIFPLSFQGQIGRLPYTLSSVAAFFSQHLLVVLLFASQGMRLQPDPWFYLIPLRSLVTQAQATAVVTIAAVAYLFLIAWVLAALAFRRAASANVSEWIAAGAMVPVIQILVILVLCAIPPRAGRESPGVTGVGPVSKWPAAVQGLVAGMAVTLAAVAVGTLLFRVYGYGVFIASPVIVGATTAYLANRKDDIGGPATTRLVMAATMLGGIALVLAALEGVVCIVLAAPLGFGAAWIGGLLGRAIAVAGKRPPQQMASGFALLPIVFALEYTLAVSTTFDTVQTIEVDAPADVVWSSILHMDTIEEPLALPFRLGVAYPLRGEVIGEGVGAIRHGEFSTGTAIERVTEWKRNRKLAFVVTNDIPALRELSPYEHVHAPHVIGYFRTSLTSFELVERPGGKTAIVERTSHELKLEPILYWMPMARWIVAENNARVLAHIKRQSELRRFAGVQQGQLPEPDGHPGQQHDDRP